MEHRILLKDSEEIISILGKHEENLKLIREAFKEPKITVQGCELKIIGETEEFYTLVRLFEELLAVFQSGHVVRIPEVKYIIKMLKENRQTDVSSIFKEAICVSERGRLIRPKTLGQKQYVELIKKNDIVIAIGPAGTGKTYLAMAMAIFALLSKRVARIILTRPAVEAGERLGFLPGDMQEKVDPYLRPLYDTLYDMIGVEKFKNLLKEGIIEVAPLAFMRGRTLNDSFIILDEAQNTTPEQMKMFLTRLGFDSKAVITGDITQIDLPSSITSGLIQIQSILKGIDGIAFVYLNECDVVRHPLVSEIIKAYENFETNHKSNNKDILP